MEAKEQVSASSNKITRSLYVEASTSNPQEDSFDVFSVFGRTIDIPLETMMAIEGDVNSRIIKFRLPRFFNGVDLSEKDLRIGYIIEKTGMKSYNVLEDKEVGLNDIIAKWFIPEEVTRISSQVEIKLEFYNSAELSNYRWQTDTAVFEVIKNISTYITGEEADYRYEILFYEQNGGNANFYSEYNSYEEPIKVIKRDLILPEGFDTVLIQHDTRSRIIPFVMQRFYDGIDISDAKRAIAVKFFRGDGKGDLSPVSNVSIDAETVTFTWLITGKATYIPGDLNVAIEVVGKNEIDERYVLSTNYTDKFKVIENLKVDEELPEPEDAWLEAWRVDAEILLRNARDSYEQLAIEVGNLKNETITTVNGTLMNVNEVIDRANLASNTAEQKALLADQKSNLANTAATNADAKAVLADQKATLANTAATNANALVDKLNKETLLIYQLPVETYADIATTYPTPVLGWCVTVKATGEQYRYNGTAWKLIGTLSGIGVASTTTAGIVKVDGKTITVDSNGVISTGEVDTDPYKDIKSQTGILITASDTIDSLISADVKGKTHIYSRNLIQNNGTSNVINGIKLIINSDKSITLSGTAIYNTSFDINPEVFTLGVGTYTLSLFNSTPSEGLTFFIKSNNTTVFQLAASSVNATLSKNITSETICTKGYINIAVGTVIDNLTLKIQLENGISTTYVPYGKLSASDPTPDNIEDVYNPTKFNLVSCGTNVLSMTEGTYSNAGVVAIVKNGVIQVSGTATANSAIYIPVFARVNGTYTLTANNDNTYTVGEFIRLEKAYAASSYTATLNTLNAKTSFTTTGDFAKLALRTNSGSVVNYTLKPKLEVGSAATPYSPYQESRISISCDLGEWNEIKGGQYTKGAQMLTLDGNTSFSLNGASRFTGDIVGFDYTGLIDMLDVGEGKVFCTHFKPQYDTLNNTVEGIVQTATGALVIGINKSRLVGWSDSLADSEKITLFKNWLSQQSTNTTPVRIRVKLKTQTSTPLDTYLTSYKGTTNIYTVTDQQLEITANFKSKVWSDVYTLKKQIEELKALIPMPSTLQKEEPTVTEANAVWYEIDGEITTGGGGTSIGNAETSDEEPNTPYWFEPI